MGGERSVVESQKILKRDPGILSTLPSSTAEPEHVFIKVNKTLSAVRSTMTEDRLEACILLQVHRDLTPEPASVR